MTDSTDRVLASIDEAIDGYVSEDDDVSYDAMRWRPDAPAESHMIAPALADHAEVARRLNDQLTVAVRVDLDAIMAAFASVGRAIKQMGVAFGEVSRRNHPAAARLQHGDDYRRHYRSCRLCNPAGNPKPLAVNGAEYRRRTRARRRRNRR